MGKLDQNNQLGRTVLCCPAVLHTSPSLDRVKMEMPDGKWSVLQARGSRNEVFSCLLYVKAWQNNFT